ncbi:hypothetical protein [Solimicrobium silvestre]|uniref:Prokaryotic membrane lipoprotein lipid attachment site n=1 Tax=Solimicrobium silvestre TaxID=2099400 RepID=A0A2S9H477_9BURK|nr:hypothetical protein [Solimicrobium silvestre]PRC94784.1 hypothetical protein S2091_0787 [Solimicrobium silvestre]
MINFKKKLAPRSLIYLSSAVLLVILSACGGGHGGGGAPVGPGSTMAGTSF